MTVKVGGSWSSPRPVNGGVPQGSILGVSLVIVAIDRMEENTFRHVTLRAESIGMKVNKTKTAVLCMSDSLSFQAEANIWDQEGLKIESTGGVKSKSLSLSMSSLAFAA